MRNNLFVGKVYLRLDEIASTNDYAKEILSKSKPAEGMVIRADSQSAGRGQFGSKWEGNKGENLLMSVILYPNFLGLAEHFLLSAAVSIAVKDCLTKFLPNEVVKIKWPNDVYVSNKKVGGILIQNAITGIQLQSSIIGIGLNVNQSQFQENLPNAGSLSSITGQKFDLNQLEFSLFQELEYRYLQLKKPAEHAKLLETYHLHLFRRLEVTEFLYPDGSAFWGIIQGVNQEGKLIVESSGQSLLFDIKDIKMVLEK
jgi:BirA family transcriptional regulator, biotin operon repressor / biotin---[acetyl-CoA-carboxylase] ligase